MIKNIAGDDALIFLFRFVIQHNGITFVLNETNAEDMYPDIEVKMRPLALACSNTLIDYRQYCTGDTIMDGYILLDNCFEVMLSKGLGKYFDEIEKPYLIMLMYAKY